MNAIEYSYYLPSRIYPSLDLSFSFKNAKSILEMTKSNTSPAESLKQHSTIRKLSFDESIEFEKSTDDSEDFQLDYDNLIKYKTQSEGPASIPCFKKIGFDLCADKEELFMTGLHSKYISNNFAI